MARISHYRVDGKKIIAVIAKLTEKEKKEIKNYIDLGFELVPEQPEVKTKKEKEAERSSNPYSKENVEAFLKQSGNESLLEEYNKRYNEQAGTNRKRKNKNNQIEIIPDEPKFLKDGRIKVKGYANCIGWFTEKFTFDAETGTYKAK